MTRQPGKRLCWYTLITLMLVCGLLIVSERSRAEEAPLRTTTTADLGSGPIGGTAFPISPISNAPDHSSETRSSIAFNTGFMQTYLVVWSQPQTGGATLVYGQLVNKDGRLNGVRFRISSELGENINADVAYNPDLDQYLVVYQVGNIGIYGQILNNTGSPVQPERAIVSGFIFTDTYYTPAVAYSSASGKYLITWQHNQSAFQGIEARTLSGDGTTLGSVWALTGMITSDPAQPDVAYSRPLDEFLVVWQKTATPATDQDIYGRRIALGATPGPTGPVFPIHYYSGYDETAPTIASLTKPTGIGQYLVACQIDLGGTPYVNGQLVTDAGALDGAPLAISLSSGSIPAVAGNQNTQEYLAAWIHSPEVHARTISTAGAMGLVTPLSGKVPWNTTVASGALGDFLITIDDWISASYPYDIFGYLWGTRVYLPLVLRG